MRQLRVYIYKTELKKISNKPIAAKDQDDSDWEEIDNQ